MRHQPLRWLLGTFLLIFILVMWTPQGKAWTIKTWDEIKDSFKDGSNKSIPDPPTDNDDEIQVSTTYSLARIKW